jgi:hypothetical protein
MTSTLLDNALLSTRFAYSALGSFQVGAPVLRLDHRRRVEVMAGVDRDSALHNSMLGMLMDASQESRTVSFDGAITCCGQFHGPRFCLQKMVNSVPFTGSAMKITGLGTDRVRLKLRIMSDEDLWSLFLNQREECSHEFWEELETREAAGTLAKDSPFWAMGALARYRRPRGSGGDSNLIKLTPEEWEARRRRKMFRVISA